MNSASSGKMPGKKKKYNARFPPARIKKIMQKDEEVGKVAAPVPVIISRALELFVESLLTRAGAITEARHARTLTPAHLKQCILAERRFDFLQDLVSTVTDINPDGESGEMLPGIFGNVSLTSPVASAGMAGTPPHTPLSPGMSPMSAGSRLFAGEGTPSLRGRGSAGGVRGGRGRGRGGRGRSKNEGVADQPKPRGRPRKIPTQNRMEIDDMDSDEGLSVDIDSEEEEEEESETDDEVIEIAESRSIINHAVPSSRKEIPPLAPLHTIPPMPALKPINTSPIISHTKSLETTPKIPGLQISIGGSYSNLAAGMKSGVGSDSPNMNNFSFSPTPSTPNALPSSLSSPLSSGIQISFLSPTDNKNSLKCNNSSPKNTITITPTSSNKFPYPNSSPKVGNYNSIRSPVSSPSANHNILHSPGIKSPNSVPPQSPVSASAKPSFGVPVPVITSVHAMRFPSPVPQRQISQTEVDEDYDT
ncbi:unnamed protein product [Meganyctiphanes norvegica]|uniref:Dr1-associated corepressor n=1 Tax=Meganyctiphanes norvegica TaxID=48144 RepID=A0AAV2QQF3_MEGNR